MPSLFISTELRSELFLLARSWSTHRRPQVLRLKLRQALVRDRPGRSCVHWRDRPQEDVIVAFQTHGQVSHLTVLQALALGGPDERQMIEKPFMILV